MTHKFTRTLILAACSAAISIFPLAADTLNQYLPGGSDASFTDGDKTITFTSYSDTVTCVDGTTGANLTCPVTGAFTPTSAAGLTVNPSSTDSVTGLHLDGFTLSGNVSVMSYELPNGDWVDVTQDIQLAYTVTATAGEISDVHLGVGSAAITPLGTKSVPPEITVSESTNIPGVGSLVVTDPPPSFLATLNLPPADYTTSLSVTKDIALESGAGQTNGVGWGASFSALEQSFSQVPEPRAYAAVLGLFFALFFVIRRRRQQTA